MSLVAWAGEEEVKQKLEEIWSAMDACVDRGLTQKGQLPGGLNVARRAAELNKSLETTADNLIGSTFHGNELCAHPARHRVFLTFR